MQTANNQIICRVASPQLIQSYSKPKQSSLVLIGVPIMKILRLPDVMAKCGLGRSSIYAYVQKNAFPQPIRLGERAVGWKSDEIDAWIEQRSEMRGAKWNTSQKKKPWLRHQRLSQIDNLILANSVINRNRILINRS